MTGDLHNCVSADYFNNAVSGHIELCVYIRVRLTSQFGHPPSFVSHVRAVVPSPPQHDRGSCNMHCGVDAHMNPSVGSLSAD